MGYHKPTSIAESLGFLSFRIPSKYPRSWGSNSGDKEPLFSVPIEVHIQIHLQEKNGTTSAHLHESPESTPFVIWGFPEIGGPPQIIHFNGFFPYKPTILGYWWNPPYPHGSIQQFSGPLHAPGEHPWPSSVRMPGGAGHLRWAPGS